MQKLKFRTLSRMNNLAFLFILDLLKTDYNKKHLPWDVLID